MHIRAIIEASYALAHAAILDRMPPSLSRLSLWLHKCWHARFKCENILLAAIQSKVGIYEVQKPDVAHLTLPMNHVGYACCH